ncbi:MAG: amidase family protein, partial [Thermoanaerobaculia bacterium]
MKMSFALLFVASTLFAADKKPFTVVEATFPEMQAALKSGRVTSHDLVSQYLIRIGTYEDRLNAAIYVNPNALKEADERDRERAQGKIRGPLHGIPIAIKDNIMTTNMPTTGGALVFEGFVPPYEATVTKNLRDAGAIIIAKVNMQEFARSANGGQPGLSSGGGQTHNPHDLERSPSASSGGTGAS